MTELRVPSIQHLARNWHNDPNAIAKKLVSLARNPPTFNYNPLISATKDLLVLGASYDSVLEGLSRLPRRDVRNNFLEVLPLIYGHFSGLSPDFYQNVGRRHYQLGRDLAIPFDPIMIYGINGQLHFPWLSFWRSNPLDRERLSLFVTLADEILMQDPDLEDARFEILDFSCPRAKTPRELRITDARDIPRIEAAKKASMLETFAQGFLMAKSILAADPAAASQERPQRERNIHPGQDDLFPPE
ncbi:hypothetical protein [Kaistia nematophila]|uniref:Uncharacterized protein n=1 Tax=Kaistia nematophila TaxID=2994654 RepID=A0A9X3DY26_9HYPH|nr:hypothetical protein [Kaistia nematophila]MCX5567837.1 hypothetical protein [Kaistia nematophila]